MTTSLEEAAKKLESTGEGLQKAGCAITQTVWGCGCLFIMLFFLWVVFASMFS
jgi:hypothetical protein